MEPATQGHAVGSESNLQPFDVQADTPTTEPPARAEVLLKYERISIFFRYSNVIKLLQSTDCESSDT